MRIAGDLRILDRSSTPDMRAPRRQRLGDVGGVRLTVGRQEGRADQIADIHQRPEVLRFRGCQQMHLEAEGMRRRRLPADLGPAVLVAGKAQTAIHLPAGREPGFLLQPVVEIDRIAEQLGDVGAGAQLARPGPAACKVVPEVSFLRSSTTVSVQPSLPR